MLLILTPIQTSFIAINNLLKDYAQGGWAPWPAISFFRKLHPDAGAKYTLAEEKTFCTYGGRPRNSSPNSPKPYEAHSYCSLTPSHSKPVNWSGPVFRQSLFQSPNRQNNVFFYCFFGTLVAVTSSVCQHETRFFDRRRWDNPVGAVD